MIKEDLNVLQLVARHGFAENGFGLQKPVEVENIINAEKSDLFDLPGYVAQFEPVSGD